MKNSKNILFTEQGCLSSDGILLLQSGKLSENEILLMKKHIAGCDLCREAVEGAGNFSHPDQYLQGIDRLKEKWNYRKARERTLSKATWAAIVTVAASVIIGVFVYLADRYQKSVRIQYMASVYKQGISLDSALFSSGDIFPINNKTVRLETNPVELLIRNKNRQEFLASTEKNIPIAFLNEARITADSYKEEKEAQPETDVGRRPGTLWYPYRIMSMPPPEYPEKESGKRNREKIFFTVEEMPRFQWKKNRTFIHYLQQNIRYPAKALEKHIEGRVYIQFTIDEKGRLVDGTILKSCHPMLDNEVLRIIRNSPVWQPGKQNGKAVKVSMVMPVEFVLY